MSNENPRNAIAALLIVAALACLIASIWVADWRWQLAATASVLGFTGAAFAGGRGGEGPR